MEIKKAFCVKKVKNFKFVHFIEFKVLLKNLTYYFSKSHKEKTKVSNHYSLRKHSGKDVKCHC